VPRGFVLPTSMLVVTLLTVMLAAAFILVSADYRTTDNAFASSRALAIAQAGIEDYFSASHDLLSATSDSINYTYGNGYAAVVARKIRDSVSTVAPALWVVRSTGFDTVRALSGQPNGRRTVAQFATFQGGVLPALAALTAANGVTMTMSSDGPNPISGLNTNFPSSAYDPPCTPPAASDTIGLVVPAGGYNGSGGVDPVNGTQFLASQAAVINATHIDWAKLLAGHFTPDYVSTLPPAGNSTYYTYYYPSDVTIPAGQRRGLLVSAGTVTLAPDAHWDGVIIAGGRLDGNTTGNYWVHGTVITGLNGGVPNSLVRRVWPLGTATREIRWDYCYVHSTILTRSNLLPTENAWVDTWSSY
jgi:type II secretory pathway pseudopilin PulG